MSVRTCDMAIGAIAVLFVALVLYAIGVIRL